MAKLFTFLCAVMTNIISIPFHDTEYNMYKTIIWITGLCNCKTQSSI